MRRPGGGPDWSVLMPLLYVHTAFGTSVLLQVVHQLLGLLGQPPLLHLLLLQRLLRPLTLVDLHPGKRQTQQEGLQGQDVEEDRNIVQSLETNEPLQT